MSISIVDHVRGKSQSKNSARTLLLNLAIYANDCCGVAWPADETLYHDVNVSRQRIHELKNRLEEMGELVIIERPGSTNLYFVAWQGKPLGGTSRDTGRHDPRCPLRNPMWAAACARLWADHPVTPDAGEGSEIPNTPMTLEESEGPDPQESEISDRGYQTFLTQKTKDITSEITGPPAWMIAQRPQAPPAHELPKAERQSRFWCEACGYLIQVCTHRVVYAT